MNSKIKDANIDRLWQAMLTLKTVEECYDFFEDLCTINEIKAMAQRLHVATMLSKHHVYSDIEQKTGASSATISRVSRCLNYGTDGYKLAIERLGEQGE